MKLKDLWEGYLEGSLIPGLVAFGFFVPLVLGILIFNYAGLLHGILYSLIYIHYVIIFIVQLNKMKGGKE